MIQCVYYYLSRPKQVSLEVVKLIDMEKEMELLQEKELEKEQEKDEGQQQY